jgi:hypothetical protein
VANKDWRQTKYLKLLSCLWCQRSINQRERERRRERERERASEMVSDRGGQPGKFKSLVAAGRCRQDGC